MNTVTLKSAVVTVTPEIAAEWLGANVSNRSLSHWRVAQIASDIRAGRWSLNGEAIKIATDGTILDGQHRLHGIVEADLPVETLVVEGLDHAAQASMDTGRARTIADVLTIAGEPNASVVGATARVLMAYPFATLKNPIGLRSNAATLEFIQEHPGLHESAAFANQSRSRMPARWTSKSAVGACHYLVAPSHRELFEEFVRRVASGAGLEPKSPELALVRWNQNAASGRVALRASDHYYALALAFNSKVAGEPRTMLRRRVDGDSFPLIAGVSEVPTW